MLNFLQTEQNMKINHFYSKNKTNVGNKRECIVSLALYLFSNFNKRIMKTHTHNMSGLHLRINILGSAGEGLFQLVKVSKLRQMFLWYITIEAFPCAPDF